MGKRDDRIRELESQVEALRGELAARRDCLQVPGLELPVDYKGHLCRRVQVSLRPDLRRRVMALYFHLRETHATIRHPRYHEQTKHVDDVAQAIVWVLERVELVAAKQA